MNNQNQSQGRINGRFTEGSIEAQRAGRKGGKTSQQRKSSNKGRGRSSENSQDRGRQD